MTNIDNEINGDWTVGLTGKLRIYRKLGAGVAILVSELLSVMAFTDTSFLSGRNTNLTYVTLTYNRLLVNRWVDGYRFQNKETQIVFRPTIT